MGIRQIIIHNHANIHVGLLNLLSSDAFSEVNVVKYALDRPGNRRREGEGRGGEGRGKEGEGRIKQGREGHWNRRMGNRNGGVAERKGKGDEKMGMKWKEREVQLLDPPVQPPESQGKRFWVR